MAWMEKLGLDSKKVNEEVKAGHHDENLHDATDTNLGGYRRNEATGKPIDNSGQAETADTQVRVIRRRKGGEDALGALPEEEDPAAKWLREHGGDYKEAA